MVRKVWTLSHGHPDTGSRSRVITASRAAMLPAESVVVSLDIALTQESRSLDAATITKQAIRKSAQCDPTLDGTQRNRRRTT